MIVILIIEGIRLINKTTALLLSDGQMSTELTFVNNALL